MWKNNIVYKMFRRRIFKRFHQLFSRSNKEDQEILIHLKEKKIQEIINKKDYEKAQSELENYESKEISKTENSEVRRLYKELETNMWSNMKAAKLNCKEDLRLIASVYRATANEDARDDMPRKKNKGISPPREWDNQFRNVVKEYVETKISKCKHSIVKEFLTMMQKAASGDLLNLRSLKEKEIIRIYAESYHACIFQHLDEIDQTNLKAEELFSIFKWVMCESKGIMDIKDTTLNEHKLDPELQAKWEGKLKKAVQSEIKEIITFGKEDALNEDPLLTIKEKLDNFRNSAKEINENLSQDIEKMCTEELIGFIPRYIKCIKSSTSDNTVKTCVCFREYLTELTDNQAEDNNKNLRLLKETENKSCDKLLEDQFCKIKVHLKNNFKKKDWIVSKQIKKVEKLLELLDTYLTLISKDNQKVYQALVDRAHIRTIQEYIKALLRTSVRCSEANRSLFAAKIKKDSEQLKKIFVQKLYVTSWEDVVSCFADIIGSNDPEALKVMIARLISEHPDIRKKHIYPLLTISRNVSKSCVRDTINDAMERIDTSSTYNNLFDGIKIKSSCTVQ